MANNKSRRLVSKSRARLSPLGKKKSRTKSKSPLKNAPKNSPKNAPMSNNFGNIPPPPQLRRY